MSWIGLVRYGALAPSSGSPDFVQLVGRTARDRTERPEATRRDPPRLKLDPGEPTYDDLPRDAQRDVDEQVERTLASRPRKEREQDRLLERDLAVREWLRDHSRPDYYARLSPVQRTAVDEGIRREGGQPTQMEIFKKRQELAERAIQRDAADLVMRAYTEYRAGNELGALTLLEDAVRVYPNLDSLPGMPSGQSPISRLHELRARHRTDI
jgi:hypothetical protein